MKGTRLLLIIGIGLLAAVFVVGIYIVPRAQAGGPDTARQSDAGRVPISDVYLDVTYATPEFVQRVKLEPYLQHFQGRVQPFLVGLNTHVGSIEHLDLRGKVQLEDNHGDRYPSLGAPWQAKVEAKTKSAAGFITAPVSNEAHHRLRSGR